MPSRPCRHPTCNRYVRWPDRHCPEHADQKPGDRAAANARYDRTRRDPGAKRFYDSAEWQRARLSKLATDPVCERCGSAWASHVHHENPLKECSPSERTDPLNLRAYCVPCHSAVEKGEGG